MRPPHSRLHPLGDADLTDRAREVLEQLGSRGSFALYRTAARTPDALDALLAVGRYVGSSLSDLGPRERELVILRVAWACRAAYIWTHHVEVGRRRGLSEAQIAALRRSADSPLWNTADQALIDACDELVADRCIGEATWRALRQWFGDKARMDLVYTAGHYVQVAMIVNSFGVQPEPGFEPD